MSQHDMNIANGSGSAVRADINNALVALASNGSGSSAPATTFAYQWWADTTTGVLRRRNAANSGWLDEATLDESFVLSRSSDTILDRSDRGKTIRATGSYTQTLDAVATLGDGWSVGFRVESGVTLTLNPNSTEQIDGATTLAIVGPASGYVVCNGSALYTVGYNSGATAASQAEQEAGSSTTVFVTPGRQQFHPSAAKAWATYNTISTTSLIASYNITSLTDNGTGDTTVTIATDFSSANWCAVVCAGNASSANSRTAAVLARAAGTVRILTSNAFSGSNEDQDLVNFAGFGDQ